MRGDSVWNLSAWPVVSFACLVGLTLPLWAVAIGGREGPVAWLLDLAAHWQWLFVAGLLASVAASARRDRRWLMPLLALPLPLLTGASPAPSVTAQVPSASPFTVASANVGLGWRDPGPLLAWLRDQDVDLLVLVEVSTAFAGALQWEPGYPHRVVEPQDGPFGIAVLSRHPLRGARLVRDADGIPHLLVETDWQGQPVSVAAVHPMPPLSPQFHAARDHRLTELARGIAGDPRPGIVAGDLNATPWSSALLSLPELGLRRATGLAPTWPSVFGGWFGIPIDHVLVTPGWRVVDRARGPAFGSDHLPVLVRLHLQD